MLVKHKRTGVIAEVLKDVSDDYAVMLKENMSLEWWYKRDCEEYHEPKTQDLIIRLTIDPKDRQELAYAIHQYDISGMADIKEVT